MISGFHRGVYELFTILGVDKGVSGKCALRIVAKTPDFITYELWKPVQCALKSHRQVAALLTFGVKMEYDTNVCVLQRVPELGSCHGT